MAFDFRAQEVDEIAGGEAGRAALPDVRHLAAGEQVLLGGQGEDLGPVPAVLQHRLDEPLKAPVEAAEDDGRPSRARRG